jgi:hypothetical protein
MKSFEEIIKAAAEIGPKKVALAGEPDEALGEAIERAGELGIAECTVYADVVTAAQAVKDGGADVLMKGSVSTCRFMGAVLDKEQGLCAGSLMSHIAVVEVKGRLLLITDGEDHDSYPRDAAQAAVEAGIRIMAIGFGSEQGSEILLTDPKTGARTMLTDRDGQVVRTRLDGALLREIALVTEGVYVPAGTSALDLDSIVETHVEPLVTDTNAGRTRTVVVEHYRWFVLGSLLALFAAVWVGSTSGARRNGA